MKNIEKDLEELLNKHKEEKKCEGCISKETIPIFGFGEPNNDWIISLLALILFMDKPKEELKQPIINIYLGGDK